ncbi:hypothetical protein BDR07DRAFT_1488478 [Suillus spraguei]|nr:hypothetical protein BDR07DRAFT_1488478 [Suillus spraguei]
MSDFVSNLLNVSNLSSGCSFRYLITWQQIVQGTIFTPLAVRMACALGSDGKLKDASAIDWYNDPDDDTHFPALPPPPASAFVSHRSGRALKPTEKIREAANTAPAKQLARAPPPNNATLDEVEVDGATDDEDSPDAAADAVAHVEPLATVTADDPDLSTTDA